jgi:hypothetical protein
MNRRTLIWIGLLSGSAMGAYLPTLWGSDGLTLSAVLGSTIGGIGGIWLGFKMGIKTSHRYDHEAAVSFRRHFKPLDLKFPAVFLTVFSVLKQL